MLISVNEYARRVGKAPKTVRDKLIHGTLNGRKVAGVWLIEEDEPYIDYRVKDGKYINWRKRGK